MYSLWGFDAVRDEVNETSTAKVIAHPITKRRRSE